jgi:hypothetical protein
MPLDAKAALEEELIQHITTLSATLNEAAFLLPADV